MKKVLCTIVLFVAMIGIISNTAFANNHTKAKVRSEAVAISGYLDYYSGLNLTIWTSPILMENGDINLNNMGTVIGEINSKTKITIANHDGNPNKADIVSLNGKRVTVNATFRIINDKNGQRVICDKLHLKIIA